MKSSDLHLILLTDFFPPGYRSGGPARSCYNLTIGLAEALPIRVITPNTDLGQQQPYANVISDKWISVIEGANVYYASSKEQGLKSILRKLQQNNPAIFYLNSMFSIPFTIYPLLFHWLGWIKGRVVLAPRGMLKPTALQFKPLKKRAFLTLFKLLGWQKGLIFHATSREEAEDIRQIFKDAEIKVCDTVPELDLLKQRTCHIKTARSIRFCITGRIHPIKNIHIALQALKYLSGSKVHVDIIGPFEDQAYYEMCKSEANTLPSGIKVVFHGALPHQDIHPILQKSDFFYLLTQGENFGHAIFEALALGKPVIISDQTPWRHLESRKAGWEINLQDSEALILALNTAVQMSNEVYQEWSEGAYQCALDFVERSDWKKSYLELFGIEIPVTA